MTLRDVARAAQVHPGTVSRALNAETRGLVNQETAERVIRAAEELGYRPNPIARGLKTNRSFTVGVLLPDLTNPLFPPIVRGIEDRLGAAGYTSLIANTDNDPDRERQDFEAMRARQVDGFITATARLDREFVAETAGLSEPIVLVNRRLEDESLPAVTVDDREGARLAVEHVVALGHRRVAHLGGPQELSTGHQRYLGFVAAMAAAGVEVDPRAIALRAGVHRGGGRARSAASCSTRRRTSPRSSRPTTCSRSAATTSSPSAVCAVPTTSRSSASTTCRSPTASTRRSRRSASRTARSARRRRPAARAPGRDGGERAAADPAEPDVRARGSTAPPR